MKKLFTFLAASFFVLSAYTFAKSEECANPFPEFVTAVTASGAVVSPLTEAERTQLLATQSEPPIEAPFDLAVARGTDKAMIVIVKNDCIVGHLGPLPLYVIQTLLGDTPA